MTNLNSIAEENSHTLVVGSKATKYLGLEGVIEPEHGQDDGPTVALVPTSYLERGDAKGHPNDHEGPSEDWLMANS